MRTLIVYSSKYGFTERVAGILADHIEGDVVVENCTKDYSVDLTKFDNVIIGSSIYVGKPNLAVLDFCDSYHRLLLNKRIGFFVTGALPQDAIGSIKNSFPDDLVQHARALGHFGHAFNFEKMRFFDRLATKMISKVHESEIKIKSTEISKFAEAFEA